MAGRPDRGAGDRSDAQYWVRQAREPVRFADAVATLAAQGVTVFVEIGPDGTLSAWARPRCWVHGAARGEASFIPVLRPGQADPRRCSPRWPGRTCAAWPWTGPRCSAAAQRVELPTYAFRRQRYWPRPPGALVPAGGDGTGSVAEARFWAAVEGGDLQGLADTLAVDGRQRLEQVLPALASWRRRERDLSVTGGWRYRVTWVPVAEPGRAALVGTWLVVVPTEPSWGVLAAWCVQALAAHGARVVVTGAAADADRVALAAQARWAVAGAKEAQEGVLSGMVSLLALAEAPVPGYPALPAGLAGTLALVQALGDAGVAAPLWAVTRGAVAAEAGDQVTSPVQAQSWALGRVVALEHPDRWGGLIDLPPVLDERAAARLCGVLAGCGEDQVAIRPAGIAGRRLARARRPRRDGGRGRRGGRCW